MPRWQSNFNKNSVMAKLVSEIAVTDATKNEIATGGVSHRGQYGGCQICRPAVLEINGGTIIWSSPDFLLDDHPQTQRRNHFLN